METKKVELPNYGILDVTLDKKHLDHLHHLVEKYEPDNAKQQWMLIDDDNRFQKEVLNIIPNFKELNELPVFKESKIKETSSDFVSEKITVKELDYFYTNSISRASKTMSECRQIKQNSKKTGTGNI